MPRLTIGCCVLQRASWWFAPDALAGLGNGSPAQRYRNMIAFADRHGLPRWTFLRIPGEPKPVHLDLANPLLVDAVARLLASCQGTGEPAEGSAAEGSAAEGSAEVRITEMLPQPAPDGGRLQEFRLSCVRSLAPRGGRTGRVA